MKIKKFTLKDVNAINLAAQKNIVNAIKLAYFAVYNANVKIVRIKIKMN